MPNTLRDTLLTLFTTSGNTTALSLVVILILFGVITGLVAALLVYWIAQQPQGTTGEQCLKRARRFRYRRTHRHIARRDQQRVTPYSLLFNMTGTDSTVHSEAQSHFPTRPL